MSGLKINFHKSEAFVLDQSPEVCTRVARQLNCKLGAFPFTYLGLPISDKNLTVDQWAFLVMKLAGRVEPWIGRFLSSGGRLVLSNSCLASLPMFAMGLFLLQEGVHVQFDSHRARFFWEGAGTKRKYHMVNWPAMCRPKECGGLGLLNSRQMNVALMLKWIWKLYQMDNSIWAQIIRAKYTQNGDIFSSSDRGGSQFWKSLHKIKQLFKLGAKHRVQNGHRTSFWQDRWHGEGPLSLRFPLLYNVCEDPSISVAQAVQGECRFRRSLDAVGFNQWLELAEIINSTHLVDGHDVVSWSLEASGAYSVTSMYKKLMQGATVTHFQEIWKARIPLKIRIFSWQLILDRLPSGAQLATRQGPSDGNCALCGEVEDATHIFFRCSPAVFMWAVLRQVLGRPWCPQNFAQFFAILANFTGRARRLIWLLFLAQAWALWSVRNKLSIERKVVKHPADIIFKTMVFLQAWLPPLRSLDKEGASWLVAKLRELHASCLPSRAAT